MKNNNEHKQDDSIDEVNKNKFLSEAKRGKILILVFILLVIGSYAFAYVEKALPNANTIKENTEKTIKENLVQPGTDVRITDFQKEGEVYRATITVGSQTMTVYVSGDGKKLFPQMIDLNKKQDGDADSAGNAQGATPVAEASQKKDKPDVELFVMSYCPYGIQAEKGILPVIEKLKSKINFSVKFVDYTLHGKKEFDENLNQYCIQKESPEKYNDYLKCFAKEGDSSKCANVTGLNQDKISSCVSETDKQFKLTENFKDSAQSSPFNIYKDLNDKYGVQGSPSLVVNGQLLEAGRDSASLLKTICSGFTNQPEECKAQLSSSTPKPGFGN
jgi:hypothetical protein